MKYKVLFVAVCLIGISLGYALQYRASAASTTQIVQGRAAWAHVHKSVAELYSSSTVVVRGKVAASNSRLISEVLPIYGLKGELAERAKTVPVDVLTLEQGMRERGMKGTPDQLTPEQAQQILASTTLKTEKIGEEVAQTPLTDSTIQVVEVLKGDISQELIVTQLGGELPSSKGGTPGKKAILEFSESPMLRVGDEYIIFLTVNQSSEEQGQGRKYEMVGPTGQFRIVGRQVENAMSIEDGLGLPTQLDALMTEIRKQKSK